ncbi:MAG: phage tail protein [Cyclobacteriaceae bacterium]
MTKQSSLPISLLLTLLLLIAGTVSQAQNEQKGFSFQGYARDFDGAAFSSQTITARFSIYPEGQSVEYTEDQTLETDAFGVFQAIIGSERPVDFATIDFSSAKYFVTVEVKAIGGDFVTISDTELLAVPYAKAAETAVNANNATTANNGNPPGVVLSFAGAPGNMPAGYLACDGSSVLVANYPDLYAAIGDAWGGDGGTNFNLPDLRGQFMRGLDNGAGVDPQAAGRTTGNTGGNTGDAVGSYQEDGVNVNQMSNTVNRYSAQTGGGGITYQPIGAESYPENWMVKNPAPETRPKNAYVLFVIKY